MKETQKSGLLFYHSCSQKDADFARGKASPTFWDKVSVIEDGAHGRAIQCEDPQKLAFKAPHNIYAERGTLSFFWRSRYPVGPTQFPIFRVAFADHSSWDACWLRIDYSGNGFDAMITDINLSKARVTAKLEPFPPPEIWTHLTLTWDENYGIKFYINGKLAAEEYRPAVYFTGLDQFGPHSRIISNWNVISDYNFIRGGDIDEIAIYDRMLEEEHISLLSQGNLPENLPEFRPDIASRPVWDGWNLRCGFAPVEPPAIPDQASVRKVEIHDAYDLKRWWWKGCDGIRETTWPGVYNRSRLKGRNDYFQLPDWDCYSLSGKAITFHMPEESYNHLEISGSAYGALEQVDGKGNVIKDVFRRPQGAERTAVRIQERAGGRLRFTNDTQEEPIGDFSAFRVTEGTAPKGVKRVSYRLAEGCGIAGDGAQKELESFICGRYTPYERHIMTAVPEGESIALEKRENQPSGYPFVNVIVPYEFDDTLGLDGVELTIPAGEECFYSVQVKDPLWYYRNLAHFSFKAEKGHSKTLWLDLRDRCLPENRCLYLTVASSSRDFCASFMEGASLTLVYKTAEDAKTEHCADRFTQVRDIYGHLVEEQPGLPEFDMYNRFVADVTDLLRIDPKHQPGQFYYYDKMVLSLKYKTKGSDYAPDYSIKRAPEGVPEWAFQQVEYLRHFKYLLEWWIDNRQIENGEMGGGLSDDGDYTSLWPALAEMGCNPDKILESLDRCTEAFYTQGMFTNGLPSIQADEMHAAEEGLISLSQCLTAMDASPKYLERAMETARSLFWLTGINKAGHRHIRSTYYNGSRMATEMPWGAQQSMSYLPLTAAWFLPRYNGNPKVKVLLEELAAGLAAHYHPDEQRTHSYVRFEDDMEIPYHNRRQGGERMILYPAYRMTGNRHYLDIIPDNLKEKGSYGVPLPKDAQVPDGTADKEKAAETYHKLNYTAGIREYYNTEGHPWIDRVYFEYAQLQKDRLAGVAHQRGSILYPQSKLRWRFSNLGDDEKLAILSPIALDDQVKLLVYNLSDEEVTARVFAKELIPGVWSFSGGVDTTGNDDADSVEWEAEAVFEWSKGVELSFRPGVVNVVNMKLKEAGVPYAQRCDLGIGKEDVHLWPHGLNVTVHNLGSIESPEVDVVLKAPDGTILKRETLPPLEAPTDLWPKWREVSFNLHNVPSLEGCSVEIDPENRLNEITRDNNVVVLWNMVR